MKTVTMEDSVISHTDLLPKSSWVIQAQCPLDIPSFTLIQCWSHCASVIGHHHEFTYFIILERKAFGIC